MRAWSGLSIAEKQAMSLASDEAMLWEVTAAIAADPDARGLDAIAEAQRVVRRLAEDGLIWFAVLVDGVPDLSMAEVDEVFATPVWWVRDDRGQVLNVRLHLTPAGEDCYYNPEDGHGQGAGDDGT